MTKAPRIHYISPDNGGEPHPGTVSQQREKDYVREHLEEVNARLRQKGKREIDPTDPQISQDLR